MNDTDKAFITILIVVLSSLDKDKRKDGITVIYGMVMQLIPNVTELELDFAIQEILTEIVINSGNATGLLNKSNSVLSDLQKQCYCYAVEIALTVGEITVVSQGILDRLKTDWVITDEFDLCVKTIMSERIKKH